jgi:uncharacterized protein (DUF305 family)
MVPPLGAVPRWARLTIGAIAAVLLLAAGYAGRYVVEYVTSPGDTSVEAGFARDMSTHHAQAVEMAMIVYPKTTRSEIRSMAYNITTSQSMEIGIMQTWLAGWHLSATSSQSQMAWMPNGTKELNADGLMPGIATKAEIDQLRKATGTAADVLFCQLMVRHHLGGLHMVDAILKLTDRSEVRSLAETMRLAQSGDVTRMQELLAELGA